MTLTLWKISYDQPRQHIKNQRHYFANKGPSSQIYGFFPVVMYGCESWTIKLSTKELMLLNCGVGEETLESPLDCKEIQPVLSEGDKLWDIFGRNDAEAEAPVLWPPHAKS